MKRKTIAVICLLMAVFVTAYSVSGTYAKYVSNEGVTDEARVAKWNFYLDGDTGSSTSNYDINLFEDSYSLTNASDNAYNYVVSSEPGVKVVAPGTSGSYGVSISGTAEVNYKVSSSVTVINNVKTTDYNPIRFSIDGGNTWLSDEALETALTNKLSSDTVYPANYKLDKVGSGIMWKWAFEKKEDGNIVDENGTVLTAGVNGTPFVSDNEKDTLLAEQQNTIIISVGVTVTQTTEEATPGYDQTKMEKVASFSKGMLPADKALLEANGFDASAISDVKFNGKSLSGVISKNDSAAFKTWWNDDATATGYYYPIVVKAEPNSPAKIGTKSFNMPESGEDTFIIALSEGEDLSLTVNGKEYIIDCSKLIFK